MERVSFGMQLQWLEGHLRFVKEHNRWMVLADSVGIFPRESNQHRIVCKLEPHVTLPFPRPVERPRFLELLHLVLPQGPGIIE